MDLISFKFTQFIRTIVLQGILSLYLLSCSPIPSSQVNTFVELNDLQPLPTNEDSGIYPLRVAIAAVISPKGSAESYAPLMNYISEKLNRPVEAVQRRTYAEMNELIRTGDVDIAFVCTSSYVIGKQEFGMQLLVAPQINGETVYRSQTIVPYDSTAQKFDDLRGTVFAFTDPISFSGRMYPIYNLLQMGETPETFFKRTFFTYSHDAAIYAVADTLADGASVDSLVLDFVLKRDPAIASRVRVVHTSPSFGIPPVVAGPDIRPQLRAQLTDILLNMHLDIKGQEALQALDTNRFVLVPEENYLTAANIEARVRSTIANEP